VAFLIITPFMSLYQVTEGSYENEMGAFEFTNQSIDNALADIMMEDGFLLKPALNTIEGDHSSFNDVFAYSVEPGDTLSSVAQRFGLKKETIMWENNLSNANQLKTGMTLKILPVDGASHTVKKGQTLDTIAKQYKIEKEAIVRQNQLEDESLIADTMLIIPGAVKAIPKPSHTAYSAPSAPVRGYTGVSKGKLLWPTTSAARLTQGFHRGHYAVDIANRAKGPIYASAPGKVIEASNGWNGGYGNYIIIDHGDGMQTLYAHNEKLYVTKGQYVDRGQTISWMGNTGRSTGPHVHFEVRINGVKYNPMNFF